MPSFRVGDPHDAMRLTRSPAALLAVINAGTIYRPLFATPRRGGVGYYT